MLDNPCRLVLVSLWICLASPRRFPSHNGDEHRALFAPISDYLPKHNCSEENILSYFRSIQVSNVGY